MRKLLSVCMIVLLVAALAVPAFAAETAFVTDDARLLTDRQRDELNAYAGEISQTYGIGVYILTVPDFRDYGEESEVYDVLWNYYHDNNLGFGQNREGMILMLSMAQRDFAAFYYGRNTEYAFDSYGQEQQVSYYLDNFREDDWYGGFLDYLNSSADFLAKAAAGDPVRESAAGSVVLFVAVAWVLALIITLLEWSKMRNVRIGTDASAYQTQGGLKLTERKDFFIRRDVSRRKIEKAPPASSTAHSGGGGSGRSGKF